MVKPSTNWYAYKDNFLLDEEKTDVAFLEGK